MNELAVLPPEKPYVMARCDFEQIIKYLSAEQTGEMTHSALERELEKQGWELMRQLLQDHLDARGPGKTTAAVQVADGTQRTRICMQERCLETVFGTVEIQRAGYGHEGTSSLLRIPAMVTSWYGPMVTSNRSAATPVGFL